DLQVSDLVVEDRDLVIGTHGRGFYVLDDIAPLRQLRAEVTQAHVFLFTPADAVRRVYSADIDYALKAPAGKVAVEILDATGKVVRALPASRANKAGLNRVTWDLRYPGATVFEGMILRSANPGRGPLAPPGTYQTRLTVDGQVQTQAFAITLDPNIKGVTQADLDAQFALALQIRDKTSAANEAVILIRSLKKQVAGRVAKASDQKVTSAADALARQLSAIEEELYQVRNSAPKDPLAHPVKLNNRIPALGAIVESADARPTDQCYEVFKELSAELDGSLAKLEGVLKGDLAAFNKVLVARKLTPVAR
ncbi:MAG: glycosyl hydrolase, partial [Planctomycetes bacterium]|nr:glycosyl hydrolase [Planctomycetota bacterium]